jgi:hypothetical protein
MNENRSFKPQNLDLFLEEEELILRKKNDEIVIKREQELERLASSQTLFEGLEMEGSTNFDMAKDEIEVEPSSPPTYTKTEIFEEGGGLF